MKNAMILTAVISALFAGSACAKTPVKTPEIIEEYDHTPRKLFQKCTYETDKLWIQENDYCPEGDIRCHNLTLVIVNKKTGDFKYMRGKHMTLGNKHFNLYSDNKYEYSLPDEENIMYIDEKNDNKQTIIKLNNCK